MINDGMSKINLFFIARSKRLVSVCSRYNWFDNIISNYKKDEKPHFNVPVATFSFNYRAVFCASNSEEFKSSDSFVLRNI